MDHHNKDSDAANGIELKDFFCMGGANRSTQNGS